MTVMKIVYATFDGDVFRPDGPVELAPNTRLRLTIETLQPFETPSRSFLRTARLLNLAGPSDLSVRCKNPLARNKSHADN
jgi:hypothetical protein